MRLALLAATLMLPVAAWAQGYGQPGAPIRGELGDPAMGPLGTNDPPDFGTAPPPADERVTEAEAQALRARLVGTPVTAAGSGRIGEVSSVAVGPDGRIGGVTVILDRPGHPHLPVSWSLIRPQVGDSTIILPWDTATLAWLQR